MLQRSVWLNGKVQGAGRVETPLLSLGATVFEKKIFSMNHPVYNLFDTGYKGIQFICRCICLKWVAFPLNITDVLLKDTRCFPKKYQKLEETQFIFWRPLLMMSRGFYHCYDFLQEKLKVVRIWFSKSPNGVLSKIFTFKTLLPRGKQGIIGPHALLEQCEYY